MGLRKRKQTSITEESRPQSEGTAIKYKQNRWENEG